MIWSLMILMSLGASAIVIYPLIRKTQVSVSSSSATLSILNDQLSEIQRDTTRGLITEAEAHAATQEIKRRILSHARLNPVITTGKKSSIVIVVAAIIVPLTAAGYYSFAGSPKIASIAFADRQDELEEQRRIEDLTRRLADQLQNDPDGGALEGWMLLGQTYVRMGRNADAANAFETASLKEDADSVVFSMFAEALIFAEQGVVTPKAERAIDQAIALDPQNPAGTYYKALALSQKGEGIEAHDMLTERLNNIDGFAPWMETFVVRANTIAEDIGREPMSLAQFAPMMAGNAPGPTAEDVEAASEMSAEDQNEFIRSMVARLADRLNETPDDLDGWMRLGNAYKVLNEIDSSIEAYSKAQLLLRDLPKSDPRHRTVEDALKNLRALQ